MAMDDIEAALRRGELGRPSGVDPAGLLQESFLLDPYPLLAEMRRRDPIHWNPLTNAWYVTRYADVADLLVDPRLSSPSAEAELAAMPEGQRRIVAPVHDFFAYWMVFADPPYQSNVRGLLRQAFAPPAVEALQPRIMRIAAKAVTRFTTSGRDLMTDLAQPFALSTAAILLGIEEGEFAQVTLWSEELMAFLNRSRLDLDQVRSTQQAIDELTDYVIGTVVPRAGGPVATVLRTGLNSGALDARAASATFAQLLTGGLEPVSNALGVALIALHGHPRQLLAVRDGEVPYSAAVEEALRFDPPFHSAPRQARTDITLGAARIRKGDSVILVLASANRDENEFADPDQFDVRRPRPIRHLAFGRGGHYCLGSFLARQEITALLRALDDLAPSLSVDVPGARRLPAFGATILRPVPAFV
jgi:cytochrome P450